MSLLRPTCASLARRLCNSTAQIDNASRSPILSLLERYRASHTQCRSFSSSHRRFAKVVDPPLNPSIPHVVPKRTIRIGPLPNGRVDEGTVRKVFGGKLSAIDGNNVLRILHHRRIAGSLADYGVDNLGKQYTHVSRALALKGLEWLRNEYPIDEARAAEEWAEKEANRIQYELWLADPETESKYKDPARAFREQMQKEEEERHQQRQHEQKIGMLHVGKSQFERNIEEKRKARLEEITRKAEEKEQNERDMEAKLASGEWVRTPTGTQLMKPGQTTYIDVFGREQISRRKEYAEKYQKASQTEFTSQEEMLSKTTLAQRLYPMSAFVLFVCILSYGFAHFYVPPSPSYRLIPDLSITTTTIGGLFLANVAVAIMWRFMPLWPFMTRYFTHVPGYPRAIQSVLNVFSHIQYEHLLANMFFLGLIGPVCCDLVGRGTFMGTYVSAGAVGTLVSLYWSNLGRGNIGAHSVGASAALWGVASLFCLLTDKDTVKIPFVKDGEVSFWPKMLLLAFIAMEFRTMMVKKTAMDHASHIGGMLVGIVVAGWLRYVGANDVEGNANESLQAKADVDSKTVDVGAMVAGGMKEVKESVVGKEK